MALLQLATLLVVVVSSSKVPNDFYFWLDPPGSEAYERTPRPHWWDPLRLQVGDASTSFTSTGGAHIEVNGHNASQLHLWGDPALRDATDGAIRHWAGHSKAARSESGTIDFCGWPAKPPASASKAEQWTKRTTPLVARFEKGLDPRELVVATGTKGCCEKDNISANVYIVPGVDVLGETKSVLALRAWNKDGGGGHKAVKSAGIVLTRDLFASGRYEVVAKVPLSAGLVWAAWTFHYELHVPKRCADFSCFCRPDDCSTFPGGQCMPEDVANRRGSGCPAGGGERCGSEWCTGWNKSVEAKCGAMHDSDDPQLLNNSAFAGGFETQVNHEIDFEIPANCYSTPNVCPPSNASASADGYCKGDYSTANLNTYLYTNNGGTGPSYANMCVKASTKKTEKPLTMAGDGKWHNYTIVWHTGDGEKVQKERRRNSSSESESLAEIAKRHGSVEWYIDGTYLGTVRHCCLSPPPLSLSLSLYLPHPMLASSSSPCALTPPFVFVRKPGKRFCPKSRLTILPRDVGKQPHMERLPRRVGGRDSRRW